MFQLRWIFIWSGGPLKVIWPCDQIVGENMLIFKLKYAYFSN